MALGSVGFSRKSLKTGGVAIGRKSSTGRFQRFDAGKGTEMNLMPEPGRSME